MSKLQYIIDDDVELTTEYLTKAIMDFSTRELPHLNQLNNYYIGRQKITRKQPTDIGKPSNIVCVNYCNSIVKNYQGYLTGIPIKYRNDNFKDVLDVINYNDAASEDSELLRNALIYGRAYECAYIDEDGKQRFRLFDSRQCFPIYNNTLNNELLYVVRFYEDKQLQNFTEKYIVEVYTPVEIRKYRSAPGYTSMELEEVIPHFYNQCPVSVFSLNEDEESIFSQVITLQDAYNEIVSASVDDVNQWSDAYLVLKGLVADREDLDAMKRNRVLMVDADADASYLTKDTANEQVEFLLDTINKQIHTISCSPDLLDENFLSQSGIALKMKLVGFETVAAAIENNMKKALQRRIELICSILALTDDEQKWRDVEIVFTRNLPADISSDADAVNKLRGLVSDETLLGQISFVTNVQEELDRIKAQEAKTQDYYDLGGNSEWATNQDN